MRQKAFPFLPLLALSGLCLLSACSSVPAGSGASGRRPLPLPGTNRLREPYEFDRGDFLARYQEALDRLSQGAPPRNPAPADPAGTGFAVVSLDQGGLWGEPFCLSPLSWRDLTDEELLSLAAGMDGLPAGDLLKPSHSRTGLQDSAGELPLLRQSRSSVPGKRAAFPFWNPATFTGNRLDRDRRRVPRFSGFPRREEKNFCSSARRGHERRRAPAVSGRGVWKYAESLLDSSGGSLPMRASERAGRSR